MSPVYADGVLVCPTSSGALAGYDLATRSFLWGFSYPEKSYHFHTHNVAQNPIPNFRCDRVGVGIISIGQRCVILTPIDSEWLYCLDLLDGRLLWKRQRRADDLYVGCVAGEKVVFVGRHATRALRLADGKPAWDGRQVDFPPGATPSGEGLVCVGQYLVPLNTKAIVGVDIATGKIVERLKSRRGDVPGNLVYHQGHLISAGVDGVDCYSMADAREISQRLLTNENDGAALACNGEILLESGKLSQAIASLRRAYELRPQQRTRELLRDALLAGLRTTSRPIAAASRRLKNY